MENIIEVKNLKKSFSNKIVVNDVSFSVTRGSFFAFLGQNGAGKTTTINMIIGLQQRDEGEILYSDSPDFLVFKNKIGVVFQNNILDDLLTVEENLMTHSALCHKTKKNASRNVEEAVRLLSLEDVRRQQFRTLSGGQKRKAEIARALLTEPEILFLDEPTTGLDPKTRADVWALTNDLRERKEMTIFLTTHYMEETSAADRVAIINKGQLIVSGSPSELRAKYSSDRLIVAPHDASRLENYLTEQNIKYIKNKLSYTLEFQNTSDSIDFLYSNRENIQFYESLKGTMDDVFLNVVGEKLSINGGAL